MIIKRISAFTGKTHTMDLPITHEQLARWQSGELIQRVFPHLSVDEREFLMTGITKEEWDKVFKKHK
jgi:hypothetical protein